MWWQCGLTNAFPQWISVSPKKVRILFWVSARVFQSFRVHLKYSVVIQWKWSSLLVIIQCKYLRKFIKLNAYSQTEDIEERRKPTGKGISNRHGLFQLCRPIVCQSTQLLCLGASFEFYTNFNEHPVQPHDYVLIRTHKLGMKC